MASAATQRLTVDEFYVRFADDERRLELFDGRVEVAPAPTLTHQVVLGRLILAIGGWAATTGGGLFVSAPFDVAFSERDLLQPDLIWFGPDQLPLPDGAPMRVAPRLAVEVRSPGTGRRDAGPKRAIYEAGGVGEYWLVDPAAGEVVALARSTPDAPTFDTSRTVAPPTPLTSPLLPGLAVDLTAVFAPLPGA